MDWPLVNYWFSSFFNSNLSSLIPLNKNPTFFFSTIVECGNLLSFLLRCGTRPYERGTQWDESWVCVIFTMPCNGSNVEWSVDLNFLCSVIIYRMKDICWVSLRILFGDSSVEILLKNFQIFGDGLVEASSKNFQIFGHGLVEASSKNVQISAADENYKLICSSDHLFVDFGSLCSNLEVYLSVFGPVGWDCRILKLHLCRMVRHHQQVSWIWHKTISWWSSSYTGALGNPEYVCIAITHRW